MTTRTTREMDIWKEEYKVWSFVPHNRDDSDDNDDGAKRVRGQKNEMN